MSDKPLNQMSCREIEEAVVEKYSQVATSPERGFNFPVGKQFALAVGYPQEIVENLPPSFTESFTGAGNPQPFVHLRQGDIVLDLGCGAGLDLYFYARAVGGTGVVYGVDLSEQMVKKARMNMNYMGFTNVDIRYGRSTRIPIEDNIVDVVASNGIYNLTPDKNAVMREVFRVLKPGGRTVFSEIVLTAPLAEEIKMSVPDWFRCIGGALPEADFIMSMMQAGFTPVTVISKSRNARTGHELAICANIRAYKPD